MERHVRQARTRRQHEVRVRVPAEFERGREQRAVRGWFFQRLEVAVRCQKRHAGLHGHGALLLERKQEVGVPADEELAATERNVAEDHLRSDLVHVQRELRARHAAVPSVGAVLGRGHELRAPAHEHEPGGVRDRTARGRIHSKSFGFNGFHDAPRKLKRDGDAAEADFALRVVSQRVGGFVPGHDERDVHLPRRRFRFDALGIHRAHAHEVLRGEAGPRRDRELERTGGEVGARRLSDVVGASRLQQTSRRVRGFESFRARRERVLETPKRVRRRR